MGRGFWLAIDSERAVYFDVLSNVHFGYVAHEAKMSREKMHALAAGTTLEQRVAGLFTDGRTGAEDPGDVRAENIGYSLNDQIRGSDRVSGADLRGAVTQGFAPLERGGAACYIPNCAG
jgi:hypothetical protein